MIEKIEGLKAYAIDDFSRTCLDGAARMLDDEANPLRVNLFSTAMRMFYEHLVNTLAPNQEVMATDWFEVVTPSGGPSRKQKLVFAVQGGLTDAFIVDKLGIDVGDIHKQLVAAVDDLSTHIHSKEDQIVCELAEQDKIVAQIAGAFEDFFKLFEACRAEIVDEIETEVSDAAIDSLLSETIEAIDELANHFSIEELYVDTVRVKRIGAKEITYTAEGTIGVTLQWGSNSDLRNGDGAEMDMSFPFTGEMTVALEHVLDVSEGECQCLVDTSSWYGNEEPDECAS